MCHLGYVHRRETGCQTYTNATEESGNEECVEVVGCTGGKCRKQKNDGGNCDQLFAAYSICECPNGHGTNHAADKRDRHGKALVPRRTRNLEISLIKGFRSTDDHPIIAEEQTTDGSYQTDKINITFCIFIHGY